MLTLKSNLFKDRRGQQALIADLQKLAKALIVDDFANVSGKDSSHGFTYNIAKLVIEKITSDKDAKILILNDITLEMFYALLEVGYKRENIYIAFGKWNKDATVKDDVRLYNIMKNYAIANFEEEINVIELKEIFNMKFDLIIANPPYGKIGANITKKIIDTVDFTEFVLIEPLVDFMAKNETLLSAANYIDIEHAEKQFGAFAGVAIIPSIMKVNTRDNYKKISYKDFYLYTTDNLKLRKYFHENATRKNILTSIANKSRQFGVDLTTSLTFGQRVSSGDHSGEVNIAGSKKSTVYKLNNDLITLDDYYNEKQQFNGRFRASFLKFSSKKARDNASNFIYSDAGHRFCNMLATAMNRDYFEDYEHLYWFPKVDWTRSWTVEEILADYGYTEDEIKEVMEDLKKFKGMED